MFSNNEGVALPHSHYVLNSKCQQVNNMESPSLSGSDTESNINVTTTYADVVKKSNDLSHYQVQNEDVALQIALKQSMAKVCKLFAINSYKNAKFVCLSQVELSKTFCTF